jgi:hypothetical protein
MPLIEIRIKQKHALFGHQIMDHEPNAYRNCGYQSDWDPFVGVVKPPFFHRWKQHRHLNWANKSGTAVLMSTLRWTFGEVYKERYHIFSPAFSRAQCKNHSLHPFIHY